MKISFNKNKSSGSHWPSAALIFMQTYIDMWCCWAKCFCQGVRERHHQSSGCASIAYRLIQELVFWRDYISGAQLMRELLATRLFYSSSWEGGFPLESWNTSSLLSRDCGAVGELCVPRLAVWGAASNFPPLPLLFPGVGSVHHGNGRNKSTCFDTWNCFLFR